MKLIVMRFLISILPLILFIQVNAQEHYRICFLNSNPEREKLDSLEIDSLQKGHLANIDSLWRSGDLLASGPFEGGGGIFIFPDYAPQHVNNILKTDPAIAARRFLVEHYQLVTSFGSICPVEEGFEMIEYTFVSIESTLAFQIDPDIELIKEHWEYLEQTHHETEVQLMGRFTEKQGSGILIFRGEMNTDISAWLDKDPLISSGSADYTFKRIWMAEGIFCPY